MRTITVNDIEFALVNHDVNGNPRCVFHYLELSNDYNEAKALARLMRAKAYRGKEYGGGFVTQAWSIGEVAESIIELSTNINKG